MLLYACRTCGRWQDVSLADALNDAAAKIAEALRQPVPERLGYPCPAGHGLMVQVQANDRIYVRAGEVEALPDRALTHKDE